MQILNLVRYTLCCSLMMIACSDSSSKTSSSSQIQAGMTAGVDTIDAMNNGGGEQAGMGGEQASMGGEQAGMMGGGQAGTMGGEQAGMMGGEQAGAMGGEMPPPPGPPITMTLRLLDPLTGSGLTGVMAYYQDEELDSDFRGTVSFRIPSEQSYQITLIADGYMTQVVQGIAGKEDFEQVTFMNETSITSSIYGYLGMMLDETKGIVVVGLDLPDLSPAVGSSAEIDLPYERAFVFGTSTPVAGQTIVQGGGGFVSFAQVEPGEATVEVTSSEGYECAIFSAENSSQAQVTVVSNQVSVVAFTCKSQE